MRSLKATLQGNGIYLIVIETKSKSGSKSKSNGYGTSIPISMKPFACDRPVRGMGRLDGRPVYGYDLKIR
jgi:hypothetical protein